MTTPPKKRRKIKVLKVNDDQSKVQSRLTFRAKSTAKESAESDLSPVDVYLSERYQVPFDDDISVLWCWCKNRAPQAPCTALLPELKLELIGPFKLLSSSKGHTKASSSTQDSSKGHTKASSSTQDSSKGHTKASSSTQDSSKGHTKASSSTQDSSKGHTKAQDSVALHMMDRGWWCPPEVLPLFKVGQVTYGYWRDSPDELASFIVRLSQHSGELNIVATNVIDFVRYLASDNTALCKTFTSLAADSGIPVDNVSTVIRERRIVCTSLNKIGLVVPVSKVGGDEIGYRPITMNDDELGQMLAKGAECDDEGVKDRLLEPLDECVSYIQFANDECDFGMGYELGMSVFCHPSSMSYTGTVEMLLPLAYELLQRPLYAKIMRQICAKFCLD